MHNLNQSSLVRFGTILVFMLLFVCPLDSLAEIESAERMGDAKYVNVDGIRTRYYEAGSGAPLVLIHGGQFGMDTNAETWSLVFPWLAKHFHVYAFDKLGQGSTDLPKTDADWHINAVIDHAYGFIRSMELKEYYLLGHSRGALPAARIAIDHPEQVSGLILFNSNTLAPEDPIELVDYYDKLLEKNPPESDKWPVAKQKLDELAKQWIDQNPNTAKENPTLGLPFAPSPWWIHDVKYETLGMIERGQLQSPTMIIWGYDDESAPYRLGVQLVDMMAPVIKPFRFFALNECGHSPHHDHPEEVAILINSFVRYAK